MKKILFLLYKVKIWILSNYYVMCPQKGTYKGLYRYKDVFGEAKYIKIRNKIFGRVEKKIRQKKNKRVRIVMALCGKWCTTEIYRYFEQKGVDIAVVLAPYFNRPDEYVRKEYIRSREFFKEKGFRCIEAYDTSDWRFIGNDIREIQGDIVIFVETSMACFPELVSLYNLPLSSITCYIPYGFMLAQGEQRQFNQRIHNMFSHIFCESELHRRLYQEYCDIGDSHVEFSGHPKMDPLVEDKAVSDKDIWKGLSDSSKKTKIIYSPYWSLQDGKSSFMDNAWQIFAYAKAHPDTTSWIYKPHPHLEMEVVSHGYMSQEAYREYVASWESLPNARVYLWGDYTDIFRTSDCILNDCMSFIAEYMYTHKPMLLLRNANADFNIFGQQAVKNVYTCKGDDMDSIVQFLDNMRADRDDMKAGRERFFDENLNYYRIKGQLASEYIISRISHILGM